MFENICRLWNKVPSPNPKWAEIFTWVGNLSPAMGATLLDVMSWNLHLETDFCAIWLEFSLEEVENNDKLVLMVFYIL
jgi:hypothetical protein